MADLQKTSRILMDHSNKSTYLFAIDALRVFAILAVILIHQTTTTLQFLNHDVTIAPFSLLLNQAARFAIPLFFLISGFVLELNNKNGLSYTIFFKKRASRILIPFIFWSVLYFLVGHEMNVTRLLSLSFVESLVTGQAAYHLYFIPTLIIFYLAFPFLHKVIKIFKNPYLLIIILLFHILIASYNYYVKALPVHQDFQVAILVFSMFIIGMAASYYIDQIFLFTKKYFSFLLIFLITCLFYIFIHVYDLTTRLKTTSFIYNQYGPLNYIYTIALTLVLSHSIEKRKILKHFFINLSKLSFFVFFVHVFVLQYLWVLVIKDIISKNGNYFLKFIWFDPFVFTVVCIISFLAAFLIHKIPYASKVTG